MQYENKATMSAIFNLDVLASFAITVGLLIDFSFLTSIHFTGPDVMGVSNYAYFMLAMTVISILFLFIDGIVKNGNRLFIWLAVFYVLSAFISTALSGLYPSDKLPFKFVTLFYWVAVLILAYYSVLSLNTPKFHVAIVVLMLPFLSYKFFAMRYAGTVYLDTLLLNPVYYISYLMPVVFLLRSKVLKISGLFLIFVVIVLSYKRMAILAYAMSILVYFYCLSKTSSNAGLWKTMTIFVGAVMFIGVLAFAFRFLAGEFGLDWGARMGSVVESGGSGRFDLWRQMLAALAADPAYLLFGHGYDATSRLLSTGAHNDILEILYDFGLMGLIIYLMFVATIVSIFLKMMKLRYKHVDAFAVSLVWFAFGSTFSMLINYPYWFLGLALFWGITIADFENAKRLAYLIEADDSSMDQYDDDDAADVPYA
jgi:hypothetical protein